MNIKDSYKLFRRPGGRVELHEADWMPWDDEEIVDEVSMAELTSDQIYQYYFDDYENANYHSECEMLGELDSIFKELGEPRRLEIWTRILEKGGLVKM